MSQTTPRKFSEKIAILERKQNEEQETFNSVMRDVRTITSTNDQQQQQRYPTPQSSPQLQHHQQQQQPQQQQTLSNYGSTPQSNESSCGSKLSPEGPHPLTTNWNRAGGSLPNVHQMVQQPMGSAGVPYGNWSPSWTNVPAATAATSQQAPHVRTRSPGAPHFHPYRNGTAPISPSGRHEQQRMSQGETGTRVSMAGVHLQPPDPTWPKARSDPAIHTAAMTTMDPNSFMSAYPLYPGPGGTAMAGQWPIDAKMFNGPATAPTSAHLPAMHSPLAFFPSYPLGPTTMAMPNQQSAAGGNQQQQMFMPPPVSAPQQLGSPSSSAMAQQQQPTNFMAGNEMGQAAMMGAAMQQNNHHGQQQMNNNYGAAMAQNCQMAMGNAQQQQQQQMMATNSRLYQQHQQHPQYSNQMQAQQHQQQQFTSMNACQPPPMYGMKMVGPPPPFPNNSMGQMQAGQHQQQQLATPSPLNQSQSAPTSPSSSGSGPNKMAALENPAMSSGRQQWPPHRHFSASPDGLEVPNICVTGTDGSLDVDCFQDLQDLHLDSETLQMLKDPDNNEQVDPACETQLLS